MSPSPSLHIFMAGVVVLTLAGALIALWRYYRGDDR